MISCYFNSNIKLKKWSQILKEFLYLKSLPKFVKLGERSMICTAGLAQHNLFSLLDIQVLISSHAMCFYLQRILLQNGGKLHVKDIADGIVANGLVPPR